MIRHLVLPCIAALAPLAAAEWTLDDDHSFALFRVQHMGAGFTWGRFDAIAGELSYDPAAPANAKLSVTIQAASVSTGVPLMEEHLRKPDFFDVKQFPTLTFVSKTWTAKAENTYEILGDLTMHGVTRPVTVTAVRTGLGANAYTKKTLVGFETTFTVQRADFGLKYGAGAVGDEVRITFALEAIQK